MISVFAMLLLSANVAPPQACTPDVNARLASLVHQGGRKAVDNVMVCGITAEASHTQPGGKHGDHQIIVLHAVFPGGVHRMIQVVTNDALDGKITAPANATVFAYGQAFFNRTGDYIAGIHETHCATHSGADNGWVIINGQKSPTASCADTPPSKKQSRRPSWLHVPVD